MSKNFRLFLIALVFVSFLKPACAFLEFEKITEFFKKKNTSRIVKIINYPDSPVQIMEGRVSDKGSATFSAMRGVFHNFRVKVKNISGKNILSYRVSWVIRHPFENWVYGKVETNSIEELKPGRTQELSFRRDKHFRDDGYYFVKISEVEFDDRSLWRAPEDEETTVRLDKVKQEIDSLKEKSVEEMSLDEVKQHAIDSNGKSLNPVQE